MMFGSFDTRVFARWILGSVTALALGACADKPRPVTPVAPDKPIASTSARPASPSVAVGEDLAKLCGITVKDMGKAERAPKFDFDKSDLSSEDRDVLTKIAKCLTMGPLRGRGIRVVGRADPRGESEYNMGLGGHRAGSVGSYLAQLGVDSNKIAQTSRGELDATGHDELGWSKDRRVDVLLQ
jgi:peptidoglycan-associated lipoprotein